MTYINFIKKTVWLCVFMFSMQSLLAQAPLEAMKGMWAVNDVDDSEVKIALDEQGLWRGTIVKTNVPRSIGKLLFKDGVYNPDKEQIKGILIHPDSGWEVTGILSVNEEDKLKVHATKLLLYKNFYWTRVSSTQQGMNIE